jgi:hypothetical protein
VCIPKQEREKIKMSDSDSSSSDINDKNSKPEISILQILEDAKPKVRKETSISSCSSDDSINKKFVRTKRVFAVAPAPQVTTTKSTENVGGDSPSPSSSSESDADELVEESDIEEDENTTTSGARQNQNPLLTGEDFIGEVDEPKLSATITADMFKEISQNELWNNRKIVATLSSIVPHLTPQQQQAAANNNKKNRGKQQQQVNNQKFDSAIIVFDAVVNSSTTTQKDVLVDAGTILVMKKAKKHQSNSDVDQDSSNSYVCIGPVATLLGNIKKCSYVVRIDSGFQLLDSKLDLMSRAAAKKKRETELENDVGTGATIEDFVLKDETFHCFVLASSQRLVDDVDTLVATSRQCATDASFLNDEELPENVTPDFSDDDAERDYRLSKKEVRRKRREEQQNQIAIMLSGGNIAEAAALAAALQQQQQESSSSSDTDDGAQEEYIFDDEGNIIGQQPKVYSAETIERRRRRAERRALKKQQLRQQKMAARNAGSGTANIPISFVGGGQRRQRNDNNNNSGNETFSCSSQLQQLMLATMKSESQQQQQHQQQQKPKRQQHQQDLDDDFAFPQPIAPKNDAVPTSEKRPVKKYQPPPPSS